MLILLTKPMKNIEVLMEDMSEELMYEGLNIEYNGYTLNGLYSFTIMSGNYDTIYLSKTKVNQLNKQKP